MYDDHIGSRVYPVADWTQHLVLICCSRMERFRGIVHYGHLVSRSWILCGKDSKCSSGTHEDGRQFILVKVPVHCQLVRPIHECKLSPKVPDFVAMRESLTDYCIPNSHERA
jgi:hypothetical protein